MNIFTIINIIAVFCYLIIEKQSIEIEKQLDNYSFHTT